MLNTMIRSTENAKSATLMRTCNASTPHRPATWPTTCESVAEPQLLRPLRNLESARCPDQTRDDRQVLRHAQVRAPPQRVE